MWLSCDPDEPIPKAVIIKPRSKKSHRHSPQTDQSDSSSDSSASDNDDILYHKKYRYLKSIAKRLIMVRSGAIIIKYNNYILLG